MLVFKDVEPDLISLLDCIALADLENKLPEDVKKRIINCIARILVQAGIVVTNPTEGEEHGTIQ